MRPNLEKKMNKSELADAVSTSADISKAEAMSNLDLAVSGISGALSKGDRVTIPGFGTFSVSERTARTGRNPRTNEPIDIPSKKIVKFKPGKGFDLN